MKARELRNESWYINVTVVWLHFTAEHSTVWDKHGQHCVYSGPVLEMKTPDDSCSWKQDLSLSVKTRARASISSFSGTGEGYSGEPVVSQRPPGWRREHQIRPVAEGMLTDQESRKHMNRETETRTAWKKSVQVHMHIILHAWLTSSSYNSIIQLDNQA